MNSNKGRINIKLTIIHLDEYLMFNNILLQNKKYFFYDTFKYNTINGKWYFLKTTPFFLTKNIKLHNGQFNFYMKKLTWLSSNKNLRFFLVSKKLKSYPLKEIKL